MPNRIIREGFLDSEKINSLEDKDQLFFVRLMLVVDDYGRMDARPEFLRSRCYPTTDRHLSDIRQSIIELARKDLIVLYEVGNKQYLEIKEFRQRLRTMKSRYPAPLDGQMSDICLTLDSDSPPESESESETEEKKKKKKEEFIFSLPDEFQHKEQWEAWLEMRKRIKKPATEYAKKLAYKKLTSFPDNQQLEILTKSIVGNWTDFYPLKDNVNPGKNGFNRHNPNSRLTPELLKEQMEAIKDHQSFLWVTRYQK